MKKVYKILLSILTLSILAGIAMSTIPGQYTGCISERPGKIGIFYNFQPGNQPITRCSSGDIQLSLYDTTFIDNTANLLGSRISNLENFVTNISGRVTNLENNQRYVQGSLQYIDTVVGSSNMSTIGTTTFNLPNDSNVYVEVSGNIVGSVGTDLYIAMDVDQNPCPTPNTCWSKDMILINFAGDNSGNYQRSEVYYLGRGTHTIYLDGGWNYNGPQEIFTYVNFNIVPSSGPIMPLAKTKVNKISTMKDGKLVQEK